MPFGRKVMVRRVLGMTSWGRNNQAKTDVTGIELHAFDVFEFNLQGFCVFDRSRALIANRSNLGCVSADQELLAVVSVKGQQRHFGLRKSRSLFVVGHEVM
jgi:hypothetical protein